MFKKYPDLEKMPGKSPAEKLRGRLQTILEQNIADKDGMLFGSEYLDLILMAAKIRFTSKQTRKPQERKIEDAIVKKHMWKEKEDGWCIIDAEYSLVNREFFDCIENDSRSFLCCLLCAG